MEDLHYQVLMPAEQPRPARSRFCYSYQWLLYLTTHQPQSSKLPQPIPHIIFRKADNPIYPEGAINGLI
jgi:hypothetical protein